MIDEECTTEMQRVLAEINRTHGTRFRHGRRLAGGAHGARLLYEPHRGPTVLKTNAAPLEDLRRVARIVERLRLHEYPTPGWLFLGQTDNGTTYYIQEFVRGELVGCPTVAIAEQMIGIVESGADVNIQTDHDVSSPIMIDFRVRADYLRRVVPEIGEIIERYERLVARLGRIDLPRNDFVHGDCHWGNVLFDRGRVTAVIDIESCGNGTRAIDYARLLRDTYFPHRRPEPGVRELIRAAGEAVSGPAALALCTAAAVLDNMIWRVDCRPQRIPELIPAFLRLADDLAAAC